jgi:transposase InsO family protein
VLEGIRKLLAAGEKVSVMLVQKETTAAKRERRVKRQRAIEEAREGHEVLCRDAVWAQDATHVGRLPGAAEVSTEVATDRGSSATVIAAVGAPATGEDLVGHLEVAKEERGCLPLVWQTDLGSANTSAVVAEYLESEQVIHLRSRAHTPTDNPVAENRNRELKAESGLGKGVVLVSHEEAQARLEPARRRLDQGRLRASRGYVTAAELDRTLPRAEHLVERAAFYSVTRTAMTKAVLGLVDKDEIAQAEQDVVWSMLERYGLARSRRGRQRTPCPKLPAVAPGTAGVECPRGHPE